MKIPIIRDLAQKYSKAELDQAAEVYERERKNPLFVPGDDEAEILTHLLMAAVIRERMDNGQSLQEAVRDHSRSVQSMLKKK